jgi:hypothetical protein
MTRFIYEINKSEKHAMRSFQPLLFIRRMNGFQKSNPSLQSVIAANEGIMHYRYVMVTISSKLTVLTTFCGPVLFTACKSHLTLELSKKNKNGSFWNA